MEQFGHLENFLYVFQSLPHTTLKYVEIRGRVQGELRSHIKEKHEENENVEQKLYFIDVTRNSPSSLQCQLILLPSSLNLGKVYLENNINQKIKIPIVL